MPALESGSASGAGAVLEIVSAEKRFGARSALRGVSLEIGPGEIYGLIGPNGAGKTTLIRSICRGVALDAGEIRMLGRDPRRSPEVRRSIGLVPQAIALYAELSVRENLEILGRLAGVGRGRLSEAVTRALEWTELAERADERIEALSGGMQRRINLAASTLHEPRLLLLDEPTVGIDPGARETIHDLLRALRQRGMGILLTTHDLEQAEELADRIGVLVDGELKAEGTLETLVGAAFGNAKELQVTLAEPPDESARVVLERERLQVTRESATWSGPLAGGLDELSGLGARLAAAGLRVDEFRLREPGLRGVFLRLAGRELAP